MDHDDISSLAKHIEGHLFFLREALDEDNAVRVADQAEEIEGWAQSIVEAASGGPSARPSPRVNAEAERMRKIARDALRVRGDEVQAMIDALRAIAGETGAC